MNDKFQLASKKKLRFLTNKGQLAVEDLWDLSLESLDNIAVSLDEVLQKASRKSFIGKKDRTTGEDELRFEIVKAVIEAKSEEAEKAKVRASRRADREFLQRLLADKKVKELEGLDAAEIQKRLEALGEEE